MDPEQAMDFGIIDQVLEHPDFTQKEKSDGDGSQEENKT